MSDANPAAVPADDLIHETRITPRQWLIMLLCFIAYVLDGFDIAVISFAAPAISKDWGIAAQQLGLVFSAGVLGMTLGAMFLASLADLYGRRLIVSLMLGLAGLATCGVYFTSTVPQLIAMRLIAGLGLGALVAALAPLVGEYSPRRYRALILSIMFSAAALGPVIGGMIAAPLMLTLGWKSIFLYAGLLTLLTGALIYLLVPESLAFILRRRPTDALHTVNRILRTIGQSPVDALPVQQGETRRESASVISLLLPARRATTLLTWLTFFVAYASVYFLTSWVPQVLASSGFTHQEAIRGAVLLAFGSVIGTTLWGALARWQPLNRIIAAVFVVGGLGIVTLGLMLREPQAVPVSLVWLALFLIGISLMGGFANLYTVALTIYPVQVRSTGLGWAAGLGRGGAVISPAIAGMLIAAEVSASALFLCFALPTFFAAVCVRRIRLQELP